MLERIKTAIIYLVTPLAFIAGWIWYLLSQNEALKDRIVRGERSKTIDGLVNEADKAEEKAKNAEDNYRKLADEYTKRNGDGG